MTLGQASLLLWEEGLLKHVVTAQALSLLFTCTHDLLFLRETTTASSCLKTAACAQHCHVTQICSHTTYIWAQSKTESSSMCCEPPLHAFIWWYFVSSRYKTQLCLLPAWHVSFSITSKSAGLSWVGISILWSDNKESWPKSVCTKTPFDWSHSRRSRVR